jgi:hypothetical protein
MKRKAWTEEDDRVLKDYYILRGSVWCARTLGRTIGSITHRAHRLGLIRRGRIKDLSLVERDGYLALTGNGGVYFLHRLIKEWEIGRKLTSEEIVHHVDGDKHNNHPENLELHTRASHMKLHDETRLRNNKGQFTGDDIVRTS